MNDRGRYVGRIRLASTERHVRPPSAASPSRIADLKATLRIAQLDSNDDTNPTWDDFEQALATVAALDPRDREPKSEPETADRPLRAPGMNYTGMRWSA